MSKGVRLEERNSATPSTGSESSASVFPRRTKATATTNAALVKVAYSVKLEKVPKARTSSPMFSEW